MNLRVAGHANSVYTQEIVNLPVMKWIGARVGRRTEPWGAQAERCGKVRPSSKGQETGERCTSSEERALRTTDREGLQQMP